MDHVSVRVPLRITKAGDAGFDDSQSPCGLAEANPSVAPVGNATKQSNPIGITATGSRGESRPCYEEGLALEAQRLQQLVIANEFKSNNTFLNALIETLRRHGDLAFFSGEAYLYTWPNRWFADVQIGDISWSVAAPSFDQLLTELLFTYDPSKWIVLSLEALHVKFSKEHLPINWCCTMLQGSSHPWRATFKYRSHVYGGRGTSKRLAQADAIQHFNDARHQRYSEGDLLQQLLILAGDVETNPGPVLLPWRRLQHSCICRVGQHLNNQFTCVRCCLVEQTEDTDGEHYWRFTGCENSTLLPDHLIQVLNLPCLRSIVHATTQCHACRKTLYRALRTCKQSLHDCVIDLTTQGIEPNPGPRGGTKRDRSKMHHYPQNQIKRLEPSFTAFELQDQYISYIKTTNPALLNTPHFHQRVKDEAILAATTTSCAVCAQVYLYGVELLLCPCFTFLTMDQILDSMDIGMGLTIQQADEEEDPNSMTEGVRQPSLGDVKNLFEGCLPGQSVPIHEACADSPVLYSWRQEAEVIYSPKPPAPMETPAAYSPTYSPIAYNPPSDCLTLPPASNTTTVLADAATSLAQDPMLAWSTKFKEVVAGLPDPPLNARRAFSVVQEFGRKMAVDVDFADVKTKLKTGWTMPNIIGLLIKKGVDEMQMEEWKTCYNTFPTEWRFLLQIRPLIYLSGQGLGAFDLPHYVATLAKAWQEVPGCSPQGASLCVIGWEGLTREVKPSLREVVVPIIKPTFLTGMDINSQPRGRNVRYVVGPCPYSNDIGFFFDELWTGEHYNWLNQHNFRPVEIFGEFCLYKKFTGMLIPKWWTIPERFPLVCIKKNLVASGWWSFNDATTVASFVDTQCRNVFTNGATLHDGSYVSAAQRALAQKYSYQEYWTMVVNGTVTYYGQAMANENLELMQARVTDSEFRSWVAPWLSNIRVADRLYHAMFVDEQLRGTVAHPLSALPVEERPALFGAEPTVGNEEARDQMVEDIKTTIEPVSAPLATASVAGVNLVGEAWREGNNLLAVYPILCGLSETFQSRMTQLDARLMIDRGGIRGLGTPMQEAERSSAHLWARHHPEAISDLLNVHTYRHCSNDTLGVLHAPFIQQMDTWAVQDDKKVSIYDLPKYDENRIRITMMRDINDDEFSKARPERMYWVHFNDLYVPSPHASIWTVGMRCGKSLPIDTYDKEADGKFLAFCNDLYTRWDMRYDPESVGLSSVTLEQFERTIENMPAQQKHKRLTEFLSYTLGGKKVTNKAMKFFTKADESLNATKGDPDKWESGTDTIKPSGKPRCIFNASDIVFDTTQPELTLLKKVVKATDDNNVLVEGYEVEMPRRINHVFQAHGVAYFVHMRYMADTDNVQDAAWMTEAWFDGRANHIYIEVGGDDNGTVLYYKGQRFEIEGDLSMCDQSMRKLFMDCFLNFLAKSGMSPAIIAEIKDTYSQPAAYYVKGERVCIVEFLEEQLKTGVAHTSFSNTFIVGMLIIYGLQSMITANVDAECGIMTTWLQDFWKAMGITMKLKIYKNSRMPLMTFHKRYFVPTRSGTGFSACALPSTIVKLACVKAPTLVSSKTFKKRLVEAAKSRAGMSCNPWTRSMIEALGVFPQKVETTWGERWAVFRSGSTHEYGGSINLDSWAEREGDGEFDDHAWFMEQRYGVDKIDFQRINVFLRGLKTDECYLAAGTREGSIIWKVFSIDYG